MAKIGWRVVLQADGNKFALPTEIVSKPVSDEEIKNYLTAQVLLDPDICYSANEIDDLVFIGILASSGDCMVEPLSPDIFWPIPAELPVTAEDLDFYKLFREVNGGEKN